MTIIEQVDPLPDARPDLRRESVDPMLAIGRSRAILRSGFANAIRESRRCSKAPAAAPVSRAGKDRRWQERQRVNSIENSHSSLKYRHSHEYMNHL